MRFKLEGRCSAKMTARSTSAQGSAARVNQKNNLVSTTTCFLALLISAHLLFRLGQNLFYPTVNQP